MSSLPTLTLIDTQIRLPRHNEILDSKERFDKNSHQFRPAQQIAQQIKEYALALVDQVESIARLKHNDKPANDRVHDKRSRFASWSKNKKDGVSHRWKVTQSLSSPDELRYVLAASKYDGYWEKFTVYKDPSKPEFSKAIWNINGFLPGQVELHNDESISTLSLPKPGLMQLAEINTRFVNQSFDLAPYRLHNVLTRQAQWLVELKKTINLTGNGVKVGDYKFSVTTRNAADDKGKTLTLYKGKKGDENEAFIVQLDRHDDIKEIRHVSLKSNTAVRLVRHNGKSIFDKAELKVFDKSEAQKIYDLVNDQKSIREFFEACRDFETVDRIDERLIALDKAFCNCEKGTILDLNEAAAAQRDFWLDTNLATMASKNTLISRPEIALKPADDFFRDFYAYTKMQVKQVSLSFFSGGISKTKLQTANGDNFQLNVLGPVHIRRTIATDKDAYRVNDSQFKTLLERLGISVTSQQQDKAILRWVLIQNKEKLKEIGLLLEETNDPHKLNMHFLCPVTNKEALWAIQLEIPTAMGFVKKVPLHDFLQSYLFADLVKAENEKYMATARAEGKETTPKRFNVKMNIMQDALKRIGFNLSNEIETEVYLRNKLSEEGKACEIHSFVKSKLDSYGNFYKNQLAVSLTAFHLSEQGYQDIKVYRANTKATSYISCKKNDEEFLFRPVIKSRSRSYAIRDTLIKDAQAISKKPFIFMLEDVDFEKRKAQKFSLIDYSKFS